MESAQNRPIFTGVSMRFLREAQILTEAWRVHYNQIRLHSALGYRPPTPVAILDLLSTQRLTLTLV